LAEAADAETAGGALAAAEEDPAATGAAMAFATEINLEATARAMATAAEIDSIAIGQALITALKRKAEPIAAALLVAARTNAGDIQVAIQSGPAQDPEARARFWPGSCRPYPGCLNSQGWPRPSRGSGCTGSRVDCAGSARRIGCCGPFPQ